ncbi:MAG: hypothetical protein PHS66_04170 [Candidatus Omnitrophica bacterium]|nr:hypothetical protein [Candidatus Omnitrophota bacterium]
MPNCGKKGAILFIVIGIILVVVILSTITLRVIANHSRLTHHQVSRIQAMYAAKAGMLYALDALRRNDTTAVACLTGTGMIMRRSGSAACVIVEPELPASVSQVDIIVGGIDTGPSDTRRVRSKATFTYTP